MDKLSNVKKLDFIGILPEPYWKILIGFHTPWFLNTIKKKVYMSSRKKVFNYHHLFFYYKIFV